MKKSARQTEEGASEISLRKSEAMLARAQDISNLGSWEWDMISGDTCWSAQLYRIFGVNPAELPVRPDSICSFIIPEDRFQIQTSLEKGAPFSVECRAMRKDGTILDILAQAEVDFDGDHKPICMVGIVQDITGRKRIEQELFDSNQRFKALMNALPVGVSFSKDITCREITGNPAVLAQFEVSETDNLSASAAEEFAPGRQVKFFRNGRQIHDAELPLQRAVAENREIRGVELEVVLPSGRRWFGESYGAPVHDRNGNVVSGVAVTVDVTERKRAEEANRRYELLAEQSRDIILFIDRESGQILDANAAAVLSYGYSRHELQLMKIQDIRSPKSSDLTSSQMDEADRRGILFETEHRRRDGSLFPVEVSSQGATIGDTRCLISVIRDITQRKETETALREREEQLRFHVENTPLAVIEWGADCRLRRWSGEAERIFGWTAGEVIGKRMDEFRWVYEDDIDKVARTSEGLITGNESSSVSHNRNYRKDGSVVYCEWYNSSQIDASGKLISILSLVLDITERKRLEEELRRRAEELEKLMDVVPVAIWVAHDPECRLITGNRMANEVYGAQQGENVATNSSSQERKVHRRFFRDGKELSQEELPMQYATKHGVNVEGELEVLLPNGRRVSMYGYSTPLRDAHGQVRGCIGAFLDMTARKKAEQALIRSEKLASVGRMAATIAHEINNPLAAVMNTLYLAKTGAADPKAVRAHLEIADAELKRVAHITRQALGFYRESATAVVTDVREIVGSVLDLLRSKILSKRVQMHLDCKGSPFVRIAPGELRQILSNIVTNALDAVGDRGTIKVRISHLNTTGHGSGIRVTVADDGSGIEEHLRAQIFEPFFTTKDSIGTGLGLWISKQLIEKHHGMIRVRSCVDVNRKGTAFSIVFPCETVVGGSEQEPHTLSHVSGPSV